MDWYLRPSLNQKIGFGNNCLNPLLQKFIWLGSHQTHAHKNLLLQLYPAVRYYVAASRWLFGGRQKIILRPPDKVFFLRGTNGFPYNRKLALWNWNLLYCCIHFAVFVGLNEIVNESFLQPICDFRDISDIYIIESRTMAVLFLLWKNKSWRKKALGIN